MNTILTVVICILIALAVALYFLYRFGQKMQVRQVESQKAIETYSQKVSMLIIDKKRMKLKEAPFPPELYEKTPFYLKFTKVYVVKAKVGPRVANLMCDKRVFDEIPVITVTIFLFQNTPFNFHKQTISILHSRAGMLVYPSFH